MGCNVLVCSGAGNTGSIQIFHTCHLEVSVPVHIGHSGFSRFPRAEQYFFHNYLLKKIPSLNITGCLRARWDWKFEIHEGFMHSAAFHCLVLVAWAKELQPQKCDCTWYFLVWRRFIVFSFSFLFFCFRHGRKLTENVIVIYINVTGIDCVRAKIHPIDQPAFWECPAAVAWGANWLSQSLF